MYQPLSLSALAPTTAGQGRAGTWISLKTASMSANGGTSHQISTSSTTLQPPPDPCRKSVAKAMTAPNYAVDSELDAVAASAVNTAAHEVTTALTLVTLILLWHIPLLPQSYCGS